MKSFCTRQHVAFFSICLLPLLAGLAGCGDSENSAADSDAPPVMLAPSEPLPPLPIKVADLRRELKANENARFQKVGGEIVEAHLIHSGVTNITPLKGLPLRVLDLGMLPLEDSDISVLSGMPLKQLWLEGTKVGDIGVLKGMELTELYLQSTKVTDLAVLADMPIRMLNLMGTPVTDLSPLEKMPLSTLWMPETDVSDLSILQGKKLESLDIRGSKVTDLTQLSGLKTLKRLNIVDCEIADLSPLKDLSLDRILFTPSKVTQGIEAIREMTSLHSIGTDGINVSNVMEPARFWSRFDDGEFNGELPETPEKKSESAEDKATPDSKNNEPEKVDNDSAKPGDTEPSEANKPADSSATEKKPKESDDNAKEKTSTTNDSKSDTP